MLSNKQDWTLPQCGGLHSKLSWPRGSPLDRTASTHPGGHARPSSTFYRRAQPQSMVRVFCWRQEHLPLHKLKREGDYHALRRLESKAV